MTDPTTPQPFVPEVKPNAVNPPTFGINPPPNTSAKPILATNAPLPWEPAAQTAAPTIGPAAQTTAVLPSAGINAITQGPIGQLATAQANEKSNSNGLLNSSMAVGAAQNAVLQAAIPIAQSDAQAQNAVGIANTEAQNANTTLNANLSTSTNQANTAAQNANTLAHLDKESQLMLEQLRLNNGIQSGASTAAGQLYQQTMTAINKIQGDDKMDAATKQWAINQQIDLLKAGLAMYSGISGLDFSAFLNFSNVAAPNVPEPWKPGDPAPSHYDKDYATAHPLLHWDDTKNEWVPNSTGAPGGNDPAHPPTAPGGPQFGWHWVWQGGHWVWKRDN